MIERGTNEGELMPRTSHRNLTTSNRRSRTNTSIIDNAKRDIGHRLNFADLDVQSYQPHKYPRPEIQVRSIVGHSNNPPERYSRTHHCL